jgi:hypothetical protein
MMIS